MERLDTRERPILFSGEMVRAILEGQKTMTRRIITTVKLNGRFRKIRELKITDTPGYDLIMRDGPGGCWHDLRMSEMVQRSPYGQPGDRLWVRETWFYNGCGNCVPHYRATEPEYTGYEYRQAGWSPSIFMPRAISRILLEVTGIRVERLQGISEEDAKAEGAEEIGAPTGRVVGEGNEEEIGSYRLGFTHLWGSINAKRGYGWDSNPWVWVVSFKRIGAPHGRA